ncbi:hypothetical protein FI667_g15117, partial [Globisporangium splendens]
MTTPSSDTDSLASTDEPEHSVHVLHDFLTHWQDEDPNDDDGLREELLNSSNSSVMHARAERRRRRRSRYAEVAQLHEQVKALEGKLVTVREQWKRRASSVVCQAIARNKATANAPKDAVTWNKIALREKRLLRQSQHVMHDLHDDVHRNRKAIRGIRRRLGNSRRMFVAEKISRARRASIHPVLCLLAGYPFSQLNAEPSPVVAMQQLFQSPLTKIPTLHPDQALADSHSIFQSLLHDIESMRREFSSVDALLASYNSVSTQANHAVRTWSIEEASPVSLVLELVDCYAVPFDCVQVQKAILQLHSESKRTVCEKQRMEYFYETDNTITRQYVEYYDNSVHAGYVRVTQAVVNYHNDGDTQSVVLVTSNVQPVTATGEPIDAIVLRDRKWTIIRNSRGHDDCVTAGCATSTIETYGKITPAVVRPELGGQWSRELLEDSFIELCDESLSDFYRRLELCLVQQSVQKKKKSNTLIHGTEVLSKPEINSTRLAEVVGSSSRN